MTIRRIPSWILAASLVACALGVRLALNPVIGTGAPYATFVVAAALAGVIGGLGAGLMAVVLGGLAAVYFVVPPVHSFSTADAQDRITLGSYALVSGTLLLLIEMQRRQKLRIASEARKRAHAETTERALRERFEVTLASIADAVISTDAQSRIAFMNEAAASLTGWSHEEASGRPVEEVFRTRLQEPDTISIAKDGTERPVSMSSAPIRDVTGRPMGAVVVFRDMTGIRKHDAEVERMGRESESQFRTLADSIPQLAWMAHPDGNIFWYNRRWFEYTGTTQEQMEGWGWQSVHAPDHLPQVLREWRKSLENAQPFDRVIMLRGADGIFRPFLTRVMAVLDGEGRVVRWFGTNTDITERQKTEDRLRASDERFRRLYDADVVGIVCIDRKKVFEANDVFLKMLGYSREDLTAGRLRWRDLTAPEYRERDRRAFDEVVNAGSCRPFEQELTHKDGHGVPILAGATLLDRESGQCLCVVLDLTERKQLERKVLEAQKLDSVGLLAGGVAHDFNNMLVGVIGSASLAADLAPPGGEIAELLDQVIKTGEQLAHLTRQMLAYAGKGRFFIEPLDLSELVNGMTKLVRTMAPRKITLHFQCAAGLPPIDADRGQIQQIFTNLALNAAEAIGGNEGSISVVTGVRDLAGPDPPAGRYVFLQVKDDGCGMDRKTHERIFDPFYSTKFAGRGLGLAAVAGIIRSHKGSITVDSTPGAGACFTVFMPAAKEADLLPPPPANQHLRGTGTVMVVDDEPVVRNLARAALERYGYKVLPVESGRLAVDAFKRHPDEIHAVVLDLSMPGMGGDEVLPHLQTIRPEVKFIVSSGHSEVETMSLFAGRRIAGYLQKPYTASVLAEAVSKALTAEVRV